MIDRSDPRLVRRLSVFASVSSWFSILVGLSGLWGWAFHIPGLTTWGAAPITMKPSTASCFVLMGISLWLLRETGTPRCVSAKKLIAKIAATVVSVVGLLSLAEYFFGWDFGVDPLLVMAPPAEQTASARAGLMSPVTVAIAFLLLGLALLGLDGRMRWGRWPVQFLSVSAVAAATFGILTFAFDPGIYASHLSLALPTAVTLAAFSLGLVCARTEWGLGALLCSQSLGGSLARRLLPAAFVPLPVGWIRWRVSASGFYSEWSIVVLATLVMALLAGLIAWAAMAVDRSDLEQRKTGVALRESEERFRLLLEAVKDYAVYMLDPEGRVVSWNAGAAKIKGYRAEEVVGKHFSCFYTAEDQSNGKPQQELREAVASGRFEAVARRVRRDGSVFWADVVIIPMYDPAGTLSGYSKVARDITERKLTEEALRESQDRQAGIIGSAMDAIITVDSKQRIVLFNAAAERIFRCPAAEAMGQPIERFIPQRYQAAHAEHIRKFGETGVTNRAKGATGALWAVRTDSQEFPIEASISQIETGGNRLFTVILRDITKRKRVEEQLARQAAELARSEQALRAQTRMFQSVLDSMDEGLITADEQGKFLLWNPAAGTILGMGAMNLPIEEWAAHYGCYLPDGLTPFPTDQLPLVRAMRGEAADVEMFVRNPKLGEGVWIEATGRPLKDDNGVLRGGVVAFRDVTRTKAAERETRKLNAELEQRVLQRTAQLEAANKELEAFTYSVSHDLRAPLRHIAGFSGILLEEFGPTLDPNAQHYLRRIEEGTRRMGLLVDELLNLARVGRHSPSLQVTGLNSIVQEVVSILKPESEGRQVEWNIADLPFVECDPVLIKQVLQNLMANALKFTRPRSRAVIEVGQIDQNGHPAVFVRDNGVGLSMKYAHKLFGVFQRLHRSEDFEDTGIGLATVQRIIQKHGGRVWVEAELDRGATFYFTLGAHQQTQQKSNAAMVGA